MEFKGTKGKWTVERVEDTIYDQEVFAICTPTNQEFITVWNGMEELEESQEANALLISKAPEMLYLLNDLLHDKGINDVSRREIELLIKSATEIN